MVRSVGGARRALTTNALATDRALCLDAGCDEYTAKPVKPAHLIEAIAKAVAAEGPLNNPTSNR